jgi:hypothetical protein
MPLDTLFEHVLKEWKVITKAPISFLICVGFLGLIIFLALEWFHREKTETQKERIELLSARLDEARLSVKTVTEAATKPLADRAELTLHIYGDERTPTKISESNIWRWYYLRNVLGVVNKDTGEKTQAMITDLFVDFNQPVLVGTLEVNSPDIKLPTYEVKDFNNRFAIIAFMGLLPQGTLVITVH